MVKLLTLRQAAERLGCSYSYVYRLYRSGTLPVVKQGRFVRIAESDLDLWLNANKIAKAIITATEDKRLARDQKRRELGLLTRDELTA